MPEENVKRDQDDPSAENRDEHGSQPDQAPPPGGPSDGGDTPRQPPEAETRETFSERLKRWTTRLQFDPCASVKWLDALIDWARHVFPPRHFRSISDWSGTYGHYAMVTAQLLCLVFGLVAALRISEVAVFLKGIGAALLLVILQYTAAKFIRAGDALIQASPSRLGSHAFLNCLGLLSEITGLLVFLLFLSRANLGLFFVGLGIWAMLDAIAYIALNPDLANVQVDEGVGAGEEAIGILPFLIKAVVRIVPIVFGIGAILGVLGLLFSHVSLLRFGSVAAGGASIRLIAFCACLPLASYIAFAFYHLAIDIMRAILVIPRKLGDGRAAPRE